MIDGSGEIKEGRIHRSRPIETVEGEGAAVGSALEGQRQIHADRLIREPLLRPDRVVGGRLRLLRLERRRRRVGEAEI